jgi:hypothetical protein
MSLKTRIQISTFDKFSQLVIGSNWTLTNKKLSGDLHIPFLLIENSLNGTRIQNARLEPSPHVAIESPFVDSAIIIPELWGLVNDVRTAILESDHDYTLNIPEFSEKENLDTDTSLYPTR